MPHCVRHVFQVFLSLLVIGYLSLVIGHPSFAAEIDLQKSIDIALKNNPGVIAAQEKLKAAKAKRGQAGSNMLPKLAINASRGKNFQAPTVITLPPIMGGGQFATGPTEPADLTTYGLTLTQTLFAGGKVLTGMKIAQVAYQAAEQDLIKAKTDASYSVKSAYFDVLKAKKMLAVAEGSIANAKRNLKQTELMFNAGILSNSDVLRTRTMVANLEIMRISAECGLNLSILAYETVLGSKVPDGTEFKEIEVTAEELNIPESPVLLEKAYANRPEWRAFRLGMEAADSAVGMAYSNYLPMIAFNYSAGRNVVDYNRNASYNSDLDYWRALVVGQWTLFDGFNTQSQINEALATYNAAKAQEKQIKDGIALEVNSAVLTLKAAREKLIASEIAADLASRTYKSLDVSYKAGIVSNQLLLDSQTADLNAQSALWTARYELELAKAKLNKAVGMIVL